MRRSLVSPMRRSNASLGAPSIRELLTRGSNAPMRGLATRGSNARLGAPMRGLAMLALAACGGAPAPATPRACPTTPVTLAGPDDVFGLAGCTALTAVTIRTGSELDFGPLAELASISGDLAIGPSFGLEEIALPKLARVGGAVRIVSNANLRGVYLRSLETAGAIEIGGNAAVSTVSLGRLQSVAGAVSIVGNAELEVLDASSLVAVGGELVLTDNASLAVLEVGALASAGAVRVDNNRALAPDVVEALRSKTRPAP